jgi:FxLD family lantipeptide
MTAHTRAKHTDVQIELGADTQASRRAIHEGGKSVTVHIERSVATPRTSHAGYEADLEFDLDITLIEVVDPGHLINMTDDGCGSTCEKSTCVSAA